MHTHTRARDRGAVETDQRDEGGSRHDRRPGRDKEDGERNIRVQALRIEQKDHRGGGKRYDHLHPDHCRDDEAGTAHVADHGDGVHAQEGEHQQDEDRFGNIGAKERRELRQHEAENGADRDGPRAMAPKPGEQGKGQGKGLHE